MVNCGLSEALVGNQMPRDQTHDASMGQLSEPIGCLSPSLSPHKVASLKIEPLSAPHVQRSVTTILPLMLHNISSNTQQFIDIARLVALLSTIVGPSTAPSHKNSGLHCNSEDTDTMRLLNAKTLQLEEFPDERDAHPYANLSHTWGDNEVSLQDLLP